MGDQTHSISSRDGGKKAGALGQEDRRNPKPETLYSSNSSGGSAGQKANQATVRKQPRHSGPGGRRRPLILYIFTVFWALFFLLFLLPWQSSERIDWDLSRSIKHDLNNYKELLKSIVVFSPSYPTTAIVDPDTIPIPQPPQSTSEKAVPDPEPEVNMSTEQT
jgi:hypothetical protein